MNWELLLPISFGVILAVFWIFIIYQSVEDPATSQLTQYPACGICQEKDAHVDAVRGYNSTSGYFAGYTRYYHAYCVRQVLCVPAQHDDSQKMIALEIMKSLEKSKNEAKNAEIRKITRTLQLKAECRVACKEADDLL